VFGDENLLAQGVDGYGGVVGCGCCCGWAWGCGWGGVAAFREAAAVFDVVWLLGVASAAGARGLSSGLAGSSFGLVGLGTELNFTLSRNVDVIWSGCGFWVTSHGRC
jgi:hypothetical protein